MVYTSRWSVVYAFFVTACGSGLSTDGDAGTDPAEEEHDDAALDLEPDPEPDTDADAPLDTALDTPGDHEDATPDPPIDVPTEDGPDPVTFDPVVFVHVTDIHQSRGSRNSKGEYENWVRSLDYMLHHIQPDFVVATGDLTDGDGGQSQLDWDDYRDAIDSSGFTSANYHDVPGNHDAHGPDETFSYYLANGISGELQHAWTVTRSAHTYSFVTLNTVDPGATEGTFASEYFDWADEQLTLLADTTHMFLFSHHNHWILGFGAPSNLVGSSGLVATHLPTAFVSGHRHWDSYDRKHDDEVAYVVTANHYKGMSDSDDGWMRLFTLLEDDWNHDIKYVVDQGAQVIIASPQDLRNSVARNPDGHEVTGEIPIVAMAFSETPVELVAQVDGGFPIPMVTTDDRVWVAWYDFDTIAAGDHQIVVMDPARTNDTNGTHAITVTSY